MKISEPIPSVGRALLAQSKGKQKYLLADQTAAGQNAFNCSPGNLGLGE